MLTADLQRGSLNWRRSNQELSVLKVQENTRGDVEVDTRIKMIIFCEYEKYAKVTLFLCKLELDLGSDNYKLIFHCMNIQQDS